MTVKSSLVDVTILMPCLNEAKTLPLCIESAQSALKTLEKHGFSGEILIADNGSTDGSQELAQKMGARVVYCPNKGYGSALICGSKAAIGKYIVMGDADASYDFCEAVPMVSKLKEGYDLCMGSRFKGKIMPGAMPWKNRYIGNPVLTGILNLFYHSKLSDAHCGLRAFTKNAFNKMRLSSPGMEFASEMVVRASQLNLKRTEVAITLYPDKRGRPPHLQPWLDGKRHLKFLLTYGPLWMFFAPSFLLILFSCLIFTGVMFSDPHKTFSFGRLRFGDHWMILSGGFFSIGFQGIILGIIALIYRVRQRHIPIPRFYKGLCRKATFLHTFVIGTIFILLGFGVVGYVVWQWAEVNFGELYRIREMVIATTFFVVGLQFYFSGLLMTVMAGRGK